MEMPDEAAARKSGRMHFDKLEVIVAAMLVDSSAECQLRDVLRGRARVLTSGTADELIHTLGSTHVDLIVCALAHPDTGESLLSTVLELRIGFPNIPLIVSCPFIDQQRAVRDILAAGRAFVDDAFIHGRPPSDGFERAIVQSGSRAARRWVAEVLARSIPPLCQEIWTHSLRAPRPLSAEEIASAMGLRARTLRSYLSREHLPSIGEVALLGRLVAAARLLDDPGKSVAHVAEEMGFGSADTLRSAMKRHFHMTPAQLRSRGGVAPAVRAILRRLGRVQDAVPRR